MAKRFEYKTILIKGPQNGVFADFPFNVHKEFGSRKSVRVKVSFDGEFYQMSLMPCGNGKHWLHLRKEIRQLIGKEEGDTVSVTVEKDDSPGTIEIPEYLQWLLDDEPEMNRAFQKLSLFYKKFWIGTIEETKNEDTKVERINRFFEYLRKSHSG